MAIFTGSGELRPAEVHATLSKYLEGANREDAMPALWDLRRTDLGRFTADELRILLELWIPHINRLAKRVAIVVEKPCEADVAFDWQHMVALDVPQERRVFLDMQQAKFWVEQAIES